MAKNLDARVQVDQLVSELIACPFCGAGSTTVKRETLWTGTRAAPISTIIVHWCMRSEGQPQSIIKIAGKTDADAATAWNKRVSNDSVAAALRKVIETYGSINDMIETLKAYEGEHVR